MTARSAYNMNSSAVKRIMQEARELANDPCTDYSAAPLEDDIFEWHCTIRGPSGTEFEGGLYHFRILLPSEYPFRPPSIMMLTPNGRFELNTKICISFTNYHEELWQPAWGVRTAIIGLQGFLPLKGTAAVGVGAIEYPPAERRRLATLSRGWVCPTCQKANFECLPDPSQDITSSSAPTQLDDTLPLNGQHQELLEHDPAEKAFKVLNATTATTIANPSAPMFPARAQMSPPILAPRPMRPIDATSIFIPASPSRPSTPLPTLLEEMTHEQPHTFEATPAINTKALPVPTSTPTPAHARTEQEREEEPQRNLHVRFDVPMATRPAVVVSRSNHPRPPILLDTAICVLFVSVLALLARRII
ncbi:UBC-like protein [Irpex rosettiformis]|uniref:UBC-like protein n=1 Tax=Irpex rosettiformis TaxID=378272 RepID=A0ACB8TPQ4_9APHY|nr:UBC-like protein [Irpex rosettiformis]